MRYYELVITPQATDNQAAIKQQLVTGTNSSAKGKQQAPIKFSTLKSNGDVDLNALQVEFDLPIAGFHDPVGNNNNAYIRLSGIPLELITQARNLNNAMIEFSAGMSKGLPLVHPEQRGLIMEGQVFQAFGNWQGENTSLDLVVMGLQTINGNYTFQWKKGDKLVTVIEQVLKRNHPDYTIKANIKDNLVLSNDETGMYGTIGQFAKYVYYKSKSIITDSEYQGVTIISQGKTIIVQDGSSTKNPKKIDYTDIIGQPTWINMETIQLKVVIRADLFFGDIIEVPETAIKVSSKSMQSFKKNDTAFNGKFYIIEMRHVGNSRQPDANSWCTIINCSTKPPQ